MNAKQPKRSQNTEDRSVANGTRDELRLRVLRTLEANPELTQRQLAAELGVSLGGVNYALKALIERGFVKAGNFARSEKKSAYLYVLTASGIAEKSALAAAFLERKREEYKMLRQEIKALTEDLKSGEAEA